MGEKVKKQKGEKYDAYLVKDVEPIQEFMLNLLGSRTDNEAVCKFDIEMDALDAYVQKRNSENPEFRYTFFHVFCAALSRTIAERPKMNYFIRNTKFYERKAISITAIAKKQKKDGAEEGMIIMKYDKNSDVSPIEQMHESICKQVYHIRKDAESHDDTTNIMRTIVNLPKPIRKLVFSLILRWDRTGNLPKEMAEASPYSHTCFVSNLGSIKMDADYHHLSNFGSNSFFAIIGKKQKKPVFHDDGTFEMKEFLPISFTIDERIGDGVYFANTIRIFKAYMMRPELLDIPANQSVDVRTVEDELGL
ncbi:MAG: 2-oxo acid dehydrogenase subunit E2 [Spirochaetales bacterium]|nr:2-oxo acid dehydrogenase subunit E2 [Spirochaetales bacterium]